MSYLYQQFFLFNTDGHILCPSCINKYVFVRCRWKILYVLSVSTFFLFYTDGKYFISKLYQEKLSYLNIVFFLSNSIYNHIGKLFHQIQMFYINEGFLCPIVTLYNAKMYET